MSVFRLSEECAFPNPKLADPDGLLAVGGDYSVERMLLAYRHGIFPWFKYDGLIYWYATNPRMLVFPQEYKVSHGLKRELNKNRYTITVDKAFFEVVRLCADVRLKSEEETWINDEYVDAFVNLHKLGWAHSFEAWYGDNLVGGLYGILASKCFMGESMFHIMDNASKVAFHGLMLFAKSQKLLFVDAQEETEHLRSLGGRPVPFDEFYQLLEKAW